MFHQTDYARLRHGILQGLSLWALGGAPENGHRSHLGLSRGLAFKSHGIPGEGLVFGVQVQALKARGFVA